MLQCSLSMRRMCFLSAEACTICSATLWFRFSCVFWSVSQLCLLHFCHTELHLRNASKTSLTSRYSLDYRGILFLTTNRVATFDEAFTSRIHVPIRYSNLKEASRRIIWQNFCGRVRGGVDMTEKQLDELARHELNGRQIKNIVKSAESLAAFEDRKLDAAQLEDFTKVQGDFERDWMGFIDVNE